MPLVWYPKEHTVASVIKILWKFVVNAVALYLLGWVLGISLPHDYVSLAEIAAVLAVVNYFL